MAFNNPGLSERVDLTENREFGVRFANDIFFDISVDNPYDYEPISYEDFQKIELRERFFGKFRHSSSKGKVFNYQEKFLSEQKDKCFRCGSEIRTPWKMKNHLCERCEKLVNNKLFPWKFLGNDPIVRYDDREVLRMK